MSNVTTIAPSSGLQLAIDGIMLEIQRLSEVRPVDPKSLAKLSELVPIAHTLCLRKRKYELIDSGDFSVEELAEELEDCAGPGIRYGRGGAIQNCNNPFRPIRARQWGQYGGAGLGDAPPFNMGAGVGDGPIQEAMNPMLDLLKRQQSSHESRDARRESRLDAEARRRAQRDTVAEIEHLTSIIATEGRGEDLSRWALDRRERLLARIAELDRKEEEAPSEDGAAEEESMVPPEADMSRADQNSPVHAECTNPRCDQVQGPTWSYEDGTAAPCDICGSPMRWRGRAARPPTHHPNPNPNQAIRGQ